MNTNIFGFAGLYSVNHREYLYFLNCEQHTLQCRNLLHIYITIFLPQTFNLFWQKSRSQKIYSNHEKKGSHKDSHQSSQKDHLSQCTIWMIKSSPAFYIYTYIEYAEISSERGTGLFYYPDDDVVTTQIRAPWWYNNPWRFNLLYVQCSWISREHIAAL